MPLVLDASAAVDALLPTRRRENALRLIQGHELYAPQLIDLEVLSAIARLERAREINSAESSRAVEDWSTIPLSRLDSDPLIDEIWRLRNSVRISDAFYVAAARAVGAPLLTSDARLARAPIAGISITVIR